MIRKTTNARKMPVSASTRRPINGHRSVTASAYNRAANKGITASFVGLTPEQRRFAQQLQSTSRKQSIMGATNTSNIIARPDFLELLPLFVQKLLILDVFGSVAMKSRQQLVPYFKFIAENKKGETPAGRVLSSPFVNRQGVDPNFTGRVIKNEILTEGDGTVSLACAYTPILPGSVTVRVSKSADTTPYMDDGSGYLKDAKDKQVGYINYSNGTIVFDDESILSEFQPGDKVTATYQYDNETVGPDEGGNYGANMGKGYLQLDEFNLVAEAHQIACYWSIYSAFAAQQEYGSNIGDIAKEAAFSELTAEINTNGFQALERAAAPAPQFNWDASAVLGGSVVPSDYLNMFKLKLNQAAASVYQKTMLTRPNKLSVGTNVASYISMIDGFQAEAAQETVGPYKLGTLDQFDVYCVPTQDPDKWVMSCKSNDIRRNSALFGEYMPLTNTDAIGLANASVQQGYATMYAMKVVNPETVVSGRILGVY